jgi:hypothetical protein
MGGLQGRSATCRKLEDEGRWQNVRQSTDPRCVVFGLLIDKGETDD